jgi:hypothetical protein
MPPVTDMNQLRNLSSQAEARISSSAAGSASAAPSVPAPETPSAPAPAASTEAPAAPASAPAGNPAEPVKTQAVPGGAPTPTPGSPELAAAAQAIKTGKEGAPDPAADPAAAALYKPNLKYVVAKEEKEIPEFLRSLIKDEASEKQVRDLIERADGLPHVKTRLQETTGELRETKQNFGLLQQGLADMGELVRNDDFGSFFETLKIPREKVYAWVLKEAEYAQLPPERKREIDAANTAQRRLATTTQENQSWQQQFIEQANRTRMLELNMAISTPEVSSFATTFDAASGKAGAFKLEVQKLGKQVWDDEGIDLPADEAAKRVVAHYGRFIKPGATPAPVLPPTEAAAPNAPAPAAPAQKREVPVIPNIQGGTTSPTKSTPKSMDDLKKLANEASARLSARQQS